MKVKFDLASWTQKQAVGSVDAAFFLELEQSSKMAMGVAIANSIETLGPDSPVWTHVESLVRDFGRMPEQAPEVFSLLLKAYLPLCVKGNKSAAKAVWEEISQRFTDHTANKAFERLVERNAEDFCGVSYALLGQTEIDRFIDAVRASEKIEWEGA